MQSEFFKFNINKTTDYSCSSVQDDFFKFNTDESDEIGSGEDTDEASESENYQPRSNRYF